MAAVAEPTSVVETAFDVRPPGERYYRQPGDVVRLAAAAVAGLFLVGLVIGGRNTAEGFTEDLADASGRIALTARELLLALAQVAAIAVPVVVLVGLLARRRYRRLATLICGALAGAALFGLVGQAVDAATARPDQLRTGGWFLNTWFPPPAYVAAAVGATVVGKPWLTRPWRRAVDVSVLLLGTVLAVVGTAAVAELLLAAALGALAGSAVLLVVGAPNRRPSPAIVADGLERAGLAVGSLILVRAEGGRSQIYELTLTDGTPLLVKVYGRDERNADLLYRVYRRTAFRNLEDPAGPASLKRDIEHQAFLLLLAERAGVASPRADSVVPLDEGSIALVMQRVDGVRLDALAADTIDDRLLDALWAQVAALHRARLAHRALRAGNVLVDDARRPTILDFGFAEEAATDALRARDVAELLTSTATLVGAHRAVASATRVLGLPPVAAALPLLQPLAFTSATRRGISKASLEELRAAAVQATGVEQVELARLVRVRPRTLLMVAAGTAAFYVLLPQLAPVSDSFDAFRDANWWWLAITVIASTLTYVAAAIALIGAAPVPLPLGTTTMTQLASSFVNRITPANVGGMALNVRYLQKAGVDGASAGTTVALDSAIGAVVHIGSMIVFFAWARRSGPGAFQLPGSSKLLVVLAVVLAVTGVVIATRRGRTFVRHRVVRALRRSVANLVLVARSPLKLACLVGGSALVTLAYIVAFAAAVAAMGGGPDFAEVGAVYLGSAAVAAAAPTPGGLGALEAALVAGLTGVGMPSGPGVAAVLSYRLLTYWLPVLPGWLGFHVLERRGII